MKFTEQTNLVCFIESNSASLIYLHSYNFCPFEFLWQKEPKQMSPNFTPHGST